MKTMKKKRFTSTSKPNKFRCDDEIVEIQEKYKTVNYAASELKRFEDFPLSKKTLKGLSESKYVQPTEIQRACIGPALEGKDVVGAAITGSGKTLAFLVPVLEHLFLNKWSRTDGIGAIIISPTRELAYQIFETLKKVGKHHDFSAGLIIGGKNLKFERKRMDQCNILICTPGRLLQHMDENPLFNGSTMEILVLDEADRCLDLGFEQALNAIVENFPPDRQTLLFSATQTSSVKDLVRLNLRDPVLIGLDENDSLKVPDLLQQNYVVINLEDKITMLWSFIKSHPKQKIIVFLTSCKQVKYIFEIFCKLRPGVSLLALYGTLHQDRRIAIYNEFVRKSNVVMFATDIASRGLDFPAVNWVVQLDCPEDVNQYIHRAGRSARNKTRGESLLVLMPSEEEAMVEELEKHLIKVEQIQIDPKKLFSPRIKMEAFLAQSTELKESAQRAFLSYLKSIYLMKNKRMFNVFALDTDAFAKSLGLAITPRVRFLQRLNKNNNVPTQNVEQSSAIIKFRNSSESESDSEAEFITVKRVDHTIKDEGDIAQIAKMLTEKKDKLVTKAAIAKRAIKKKIQTNVKHKFDEDGNEILDTRKQLQSTIAKTMDETSTTGNGIDIELAKKLLSEEDKFDKQRFKAMVKQRHKKIKNKLKESEDKETADTALDVDSENSVDLSWLPDPKKVYKSRQETDSPLHSADEEPPLEDYPLEPVKKKLKISQALTLGDAEAIAAQLLANSN